MTAYDYLALLSFQNCKISGADFKNIKKTDKPEDFAKKLSFEKTREYLESHKNWWKQAEQDYLYCKKRNYQLLSPQHKNYPQKILKYYESLPIFWVLGEIFEQTRITFVGSRSADSLALNWMDFYLPSVIKQQSILTVSGGARGIDQKAHKIAIRCQKPTLCFLPSGLDKLYPSSLIDIKSAVLDNGGAFISSFAPWAPMQKSHFHIRNAFMSAYSDLVVILQAQKRSGTMLTAQKALELGTPLAVLPGPVLSARWTGNLELIYDGANLIRDSIDLSVLIESLKQS